VARQRHAAQAIDLAHHLLRRQVHVPEVEARQDVRVHAVDQHVPVVGLDLGGVEDEEPMTILELAVVPRQVELAVLREHDAVDRSLGALAQQDLQVRLDGSPAVVRQLGVEMEIENHALCPWRRS
jgi:hypothetical protein